MSQKESIIRDSAYFLPGNFLGQIISLFRGIIVRNLLGPFGYGWLSIFTLIGRYAGYADLGAVNAMDREVPLSRGRKDHSGERDIENNVFAFTLITSIVIALGLFIYSFVSRRPYFENFAFTVKIFAVFLVFNRLSTFLSIFLRTHKKFRLLTKLNVLRDALALVFIIFLVKKNQPAGVFGAEIISMVAFFLLCMKGFSHPFSLNFNFSIIKNLISVGFPLLLLSLTAITLRSLDRFMIITFLKEPLLLGYYSAGLLFSNTLLQIPDSVSVILFPRLLEDFGRNSAPAGVKKYVEDPTIILAYLMGIIIALAILISPIFLKYFLPKYIAGLKPLRIVCAGAFFMSLINMSGHFLIATNRQHRFLGIGGMCIVLGIFLSYIFTRHGMGLVGIAWAMAAVNFIYSILIIGYALKVLQKSGKDTIRFFLKIYLPFAYFAAWVIALHRVGEFTGPWQADLGVLILRIMALGLISLPFLIYIEKRYSLFRGIGKVLWRE